MRLTAGDTVDEEVHDCHSLTELWIQFKAEHSTSGVLVYESDTETAAAAMMMMATEVPERTIKDWQDEIDSHNEPGSLVHWCSTREEFEEGLPWTKVTLID